YDPAQDAVAQNYGKDNNEGYGRVNVDAAVDAVLHGITPGESANLSLVSSEATWTSTALTPLGLYAGEYQLEKAQQPKAFARHINVTEAELSSVYGSGDANFVVDVPAGADLDVFIYKPATGPNGQPLLLARSVNAGLGTDEVVSFQPTVAGQYYVVVKAVSGEGSATLTFNAEPCTDCEPDPVAPVSQFTATTNELQVSLNDTSSDSDGTVTSWSWEFGDGNTSAEQNPVHDYAAPGSYSVKLTVTDNDSLSSSSTQLVQVSETGGGGGDPTPGTNELINGQTTTDINVPDKESLVFYIDVEANALPLSVILDGNNGDADLYVSFGEEPTTSNYDEKSASSNSDESITVSSPQAGRYYVLVHGYDASTDLSLTATYSVDAPATGPRYENTTAQVIGTTADLVVTSDVDVDRTGASNGIEVAVDISHTYIGDLELNLIAPDGSKHQLRARSGGSANDIVESYSLNLGAVESVGLWTLEVTDHASRDGGQLNSWSLQFQD
ncbi:MAG: PKD domain-containing protein, partial [Psychrosphaera sp.]|nr:PKD domain-containing protein [Psychrosphaera sp.]